MQRVLKLAFCLYVIGLTYCTPYTFAESGRESLLEAEKQINVSSYRPTYPEIQLGYAKELAVDESGTVYMDDEAIQGNLNDKGQLYIEAVKGEGDIYFVIEKGGYILSILAERNQLMSHDGKIVQIQLVDWLYGRNGLADKEGFKSNLVPKGFLPKTNLEDTANPNHEETTTQPSIVIWGVVAVSLLILMTNTFHHHLQNRGRSL